MTEVNDDAAPQVPQVLQSNDDDAQKLINIKFKDNTELEVHFQLKRSVPLGQLIKTYCDTQKVAPNTLRFTFDGVRIAAADTPMSLHMKDNDVIDVHPEQSGGREGSAVPKPENKGELESRLESELNIAAKPEAKPEAKGDQFLTITVKRGDETGAEKDVVEFKAKRTTPTAKLIAAYEKSKGVKPGTLDFWYEEKRLSGVETAESLEMVGDAVIEAILDSTAG